MAFFGSLHLDSCDVLYSRLIALIYLSMLHPEFPPVLMIWWLRVEFKDYRLSGSDICPQAVFLL